MNMTEDISDKEYLDDPTCLFPSKRSRLYNAELKGKLEDGEKTMEIYNSTECQNTQFPYRKTQTILGATFFEIDRNVELLSQCCPLSIRLVDCKKYFNKCIEKANLNELENIINKTIENRSKLKNIEQVCDTFKNKFHIDENSNKKSFKNTKRYVDSLFFKKSNINTNLKQSTTNQLKSSNVKLTKIVTPKKSIRRKITDNNENILENKRKEASGSHSMNYVKESVKSSNNFTKINKIKSAISKIHNIPSLSVSIRRDNKNMNANKSILTLNNPSMNTFIMPCCWTHAFSQDMIGEVSINNEKTTNRKENGTIAEENMTAKKRLYDAAVNRILQETPSQFSTGLQSPVLNDQDRYRQSYPINFSQPPAVENASPKNNTEPQQLLRPVVNTYQIQNTNDMSKAFRHFSNDGTVIRPDTPKASIVTQKIKEPQKLKANKKFSREGKKSRISDKNPILKRPPKMTTSDITKGNDLSNKGYSPAVLPIPTFQSTFNEIIKLQAKYKRLNKLKES